MNSEHHTDKLWNTIGEQANKITELEEIIRVQCAEIESLRANFVMARHDGYVRGLTEAQFNR